MLNLLKSIRNIRRDLKHTEGRKVYPNRAWHDRAIAAREANKIAPKNPNSIALDTQEPPRPPVRRFS